MLPREIALIDFANRQNYFDFDRFVQEIRHVPLCDLDLPSNELPPDCYEMAGTPGELVERLEAQNLDPLIIPHGSSWGLYTPPGTTWDKQLSADQRPEAFPLIEIFSGHGNSEEYRSWRPLLGDNDAPVCPEPTADFLPSCWRAGQIIEQRCLADGENASECTA